MVSPLSFEPYSPIFRDACMALFDGNCPKFFAPCERKEFITFLSETKTGYYVVLAQDVVVAAFGVSYSDGQWSLRWIMVDSERHGQGTGDMAMHKAIEIARNAGGSTLHIAASHVSALFFERFGAERVHYTLNGWGEGMHRIDMELPL